MGFLPTTLITQGRSGVLPFPANRLPVLAKLGDASRQSHRQFETLKFSSMSCAARQALPITGVHDYRSLKSSRNARGLSVFDAANLLEGY
jgi:hypothetical protein